MTMTHGPTVAAVSETWLKECQAALSPEDISHSEQVRVNSPKLGGLCHSCARIMRNGKLYLL